MDRLDGAAVRGWALAAADALARSAGRIDAVNLFPVPDSDTGTNAALTIAGGAWAAGRLPGSADAAGVARAFARGSLEAARGSSGVIVSQYLAGLAEGLEAFSDQDRPGRPDVPARRSGAVVVGRALVRAAQQSARAVARPQEGTVLTVARQVGEQALRAAEAGTPLRSLLGATLEDARRDLRRTSAANPVLREAGVVDAGACALLVLLGELERTLASRVDAGPAEADALDWLPDPAPRPVAGAGRLDGGMFEVMMLVRPPQPDAQVGDRLRRQLAAVGDSVAVVGTDELWQLHVHTDVPAAAIDAAASEGRREQVVVRLVEGAAAQVSAGDDLGVVIGTPAPGTASWFATGGAVVVVECPEAPVTSAHLVRAVDDTGAEHVVLLPGTASVLSAAAGVVDAARTAGRLTGVGVDVVEEAVDVLGTAVAALAVLGAHGGDRRRRADQARAALNRLRTCDVDASEGVGGVLTAVGRLVADGRAVQAVTVQQAGPYDAAPVLLERLADRFPELEATVVGPVGAGPAWRIGVD